MSGLFASLIERVSLAAPVLERRTRVLFEPPAEIASPLMRRDLVWGDEEAEALSPPRPAATSMSAALLSPLPSPEPLPRQIVVPAAAIAARPTPPHSPATVV